jgi:hypothetical protein
MTPLRPQEQQLSREKTPHLVGNTAAIKPIAKWLLGPYNSQKLNFLKNHAPPHYSPEYSDLLVITFCSFHFGFVWQRMWRKVGGQSVSVVEVLELEALMVQSHSMMFGAYNVQMK